MNARIPEIDNQFDYALKTIEPNHLIQELRSALPRMSKWQVEEVMAQASHTRKLRFKRQKGVKYGTLSKGFTDQQLQAFFRVIDNPKYKLLFAFQANLGLRIGEVIKVNIRQINFETRELTIKTEKTKLVDSLLIPIPLFRDMIEFIKANASGIERSQGYLFFRESKFSNRVEPYLEPNFVRNRFGEYLQRSGLDEVYDISEEQNGRTPRRLHRLSTHSLRHYAITRFAKNANGNILLTAKFARHIDTSSTMVYVRTDKKDVYDVIDTIAMSEVALLKKKLSDRNEK